MGSGNRTEATGDCYVANGRYVFEAALVNQAHGYTLVHGELTVPGKLEGRRIDHAWVEIDDGPVVVVVDLSNDQFVVLHRDLYYHMGEVVPEDCRRYTPEQVIVQMVQTKHWGPWEGGDYDVA